MRLTAGNSFPIKRQPPSGPGAAVGVCKQRRRSENDFRGCGALTADDDLSGGGAVDALSLKVEIFDRGVAVVVADCGDSGEFLDAEGGIDNLRVGVTLVVAQGEANFIPSGTGVCGDN